MGAGGTAGGGVEAGAAISAGRSSAGGPTPMRLTVVSLLVALGLMLLPGLAATQEASSLAPSRSEPTLTDEQLESSVQRFKELAKAGQFQLVYPAEGVVVDLPGPTRVEGAS